MITFVIENNDLKKEIAIEPEEKVLSLKKKIIDLFDLRVKYIDLEIVLERPIRSLGKFNLESGPFPRTFDNYSLDRWDIENRFITLKFVEIEDHDPSIRKKIVKKGGSGVYRAPGSQTIESGSTYIEPQFNLDSESDFPSLG